MNELTRKAETIGAEIRALTAQAKYMTLFYGVEIGRRLKEAKETVPHGQFGKFLEEETEYSSSSAARFMKLFEEYAPALAAGGSNFPTLGNLSVSNALRLLALPEGERETFAEEHDVENISARELEKLIAERDEALKRAETAEAHQQIAEKDLAAAEARADTAEEALKGLRVEYDAVNSNYDNLENERAELERELEELRAKPVDVAVAVDEEAVKKAAEEAAAEAEKHWSKKLADAQRDAEDLKSALQEAQRAAEEAEKKAVGGGAEYEEKIAALQKQLAMSGAEITRFKLLFDEWQQAFNRVADALQDISEETRAKMSEAVRTVLDGQVNRI